VKRIMLPISTESKGFLISRYSYLNLIQQDRFRANDNQLLLSRLFATASDLTYPTVYQPIKNSFTLHVLDHISIDALMAWTASRVLHSQFQATACISFHFEDHVKTAKQQIDLAPK